ncbi:MAG: RNA polymerase sigma factor [Planctomycetes bacterium]|nr:RNA polymerase sigma factor [Planctomycetota bacterium]
MRHATETDEQLLAALAKGERSALAELARRHEVKLLGLASGLLGWRADLACDAVQETWVRVIRFAGKFNGRSSFKTWVYRIVINQCRNLQSVQPSPMPAEPVDPSSDDNAGPAKAAETAETNDALRAAVRALAPDKQAIVLLCYHDVMTHEQAAEILEIPLGTVKSRLHAALHELRARLSPEVKP